MRTSSHKKDLSASSAERNLTSIDNNLKGSTYLRLANSSEEKQN